MLFSFVLVFHLLTAVVTGVVIVYTLYVVRYNIDTSYRTCALALGFIAAFEVITGTTLALLSPELSAASLTLHIVEYLGVCLIVEALLFIRMQKTLLTFPIRAASSPVLASILLFTAAMSFGF